MKIVIDMMGGDNGHTPLVPAVNSFAKKFKDVEVFAVGKKELLTDLDSRIKVVDAQDVVAMDASPLDVIRAKESSMHKAVMTVLSEGADAIVSAGGTGAFLGATTIKLKLVEGVERAAILAPFPTKIKGKYVAILDIGASNENNVTQMHQFAKMGQIYAKSVLNVQEPKTYLLSNGTEDSKGSPLVSETFKHLKEVNFPHFYGHMEGRDVLNGEADVVVADGYTGNVLLKSVEGAAKLLMGLLKEAFNKNIFTKIGYLFSKSGIKDMRDTFDYKNTGGAILLGVNNVVVKAHGNSDEKGFYSALLVANKMVETNIVNQLRDGMKNE